MKSRKTAIAFATIGLLSPVFFGCGSDSAPAPINVSNDAAAQDGGSESSLVDTTVESSVTDSSDLDTGEKAEGGESTPDADGGESTPDAAPSCATMPFPKACLESATSQIQSGAFGSIGPYAVTAETMKNPHLTAPGDVTVYRPTLAGKVPVLFFSHAYGATDPTAYVDLFNMLASNGYAVVHVPYPSLPLVQEKNKDRYDCLWQGFLTASVKYDSNFDLSRVGFFGHSFGAGATPEMTRRGVVEKGWGTAGRFMFMMAPWYSWGTGYDTLPQDLRSVVQVYADDDKNDHEIARVDIWNKLPSAMEKAWQLIRSDSCSCGLNAPHTLPMTRTTLTPNPENVLNAYDQYGIWQRIHALAKYAFDKDANAKAIAYGTDSYMGTWVGCAGAKVRPMESSLSTPIVSACQTYMYPLSERCKQADPSYQCP